MNLSEEINGVLKKSAIVENIKNFSESLLGMLFATLFTVFMGYNLKESVIGLTISFGIGAFLLFVSARYFYSTLIKLDAESLNKWFMSLPPHSFSYLNREVESLVIKRYQGEKNIVQLNEYEIVKEGVIPYLTFVLNEETICIPIFKVKYDNGEKRVEFYVLDRDWSINMRKGNRIGFQLYNI